jgi:hypothetical protein
MKDLLLVVLLLGVVYPIVIFGLDFLPERARHGQAQKILDSINPSGKQIIKFYLIMHMIFIYRIIARIYEILNCKSFKVEELSKSNF